MTGVTAAEFQPVTSTNVSGASVTGVTGRQHLYGTLNTGTGTGTIGLNLIDDDSIVDASGTPLGGTGAGNGTFIGPVYDKTNAEVTLTSVTNPINTSNEVPLPPPVAPVRSRQHFGGGHRRNQQHYGPNHDRGVGRNLVDQPVLMSPAWPTAPSLIRPLPPMRTATRPPPR